MNMPRKGTEVRAFSVTPRAGVEVPDRHSKPRDQMTVAELQAELDRLEAAFTLDGGETNAVDEERHRAGLERLAIAAAGRPRAPSDADGDRELAALGISTWGPMPEKR